MKTCSAGLHPLSRDRCILEPLYRGNRYIAVTVTVTAHNDRAEQAREFSARLFEEGVFASAICFPMVPRGTARVRVIVSATFSKEDCDLGLAAFEKVKAELC